VVSVSDKKTTQAELRSGRVQGLHWGLETSLDGEQQELVDLVKTSAAGSTSQLNLSRFDQ